MTDDCDNPEKGLDEACDASPPAVSPVSGPLARRRVLALGAVAASSVVTVRPALASTAASVLNCRIPIPDPGHAGQYVAKDGSLVAPNTQGAYPPTPRPVTGEEAKQMINGLTPPGMDPQARQAYVNYIRKLQQGTSGFTCYASLQMPRR